MAGTATLVDLSRWAGASADKVRNASFAKPLQAIKILLRAGVQANFDRQQSPDGAPWQPLAMERARPGGTNKALRDRGLLMASVTAGGAGHVESITAAELVLGTNLEYARLHQEGGTVVPKGHPYLAIPRTPEAYLAGSPRRMPGLRFVKGRGRGAVFLDSSGAVQFVLTPSVTIPARPFIGVRKETQDEIPEIIGDYLLGLAV